MIMRHIFVDKTCSNGSETAMPLLRNTISFSMANERCLEFKTQWPAIASCGSGKSSNELCAKAANGAESVGITPHSMAVQCKTWQTSEFFRKKVRSGRAHWAVLEASQLHNHPNYPLECIDQMSIVATNNCCPSKLVPFKYAIYEEIIELIRVFFCSPVWLRPPIAWHNCALISKSQSQSGLQIFNFRQFPKQFQLNALTFEKK